VTKRISALITIIALLFPVLPISARAVQPDVPTSFTETRTLSEDGGKYHLYRHTSTGAQVVWHENNEDERMFMAGFRTPPQDSRGENHVLEHALLCGSEKYPVHDLMHVLQNSSMAEELNAYTSEDYTCYVIRTKNEADFYNLSDVYMSSILFPLVLKDENIFRQQGIRLEYSEGKVQYNGIVFTELKLRSYDTDNNSIEFVNDKLWENLYPNGTPTLDSGGAIPDILSLTYEDVIKVYNTYYKPSNMLIFVSGKQDISKTLNMFDGYLSQVKATDVPTITFDSKPSPPSEILQEYNLTDNTKTVDIGFMAAGPDVLDLRKSEAWEALVSFIQRRLKEELPDADVYTTGGMGGGIYNVGIILCGIPASNRDDAVDTFKRLLDQAANTGIPTEALGEVLDDQRKAVQFCKEEIFTGFTYAGDPFARVGRDKAIDSLRTDNMIFKQLASDWKNTPNQTIVISGNGAAKNPIPEPELSPAELEKVRKDAEAFNIWANTPSSPEALASLPQLTKEELGDDPFDKPQSSETTGEAVWYNTKDEDGEPSFSLFFPIEAKRNDLSAWCLLCEFLNDRMENNGLSAYAGVSPCAAKDNPDSLSPRFHVYCSAERGGTKEQMQKLAQFLQNPPLDDNGTQALRDFLKERKAQIKEIYLDPYAMEYDYKLRCGSQSERFISACPSGFNNSSPSYRDFINKALDNPENDTALLKRLRGLLAQALRRGGVITDFSGAETDRTGFKETASAFLSALPVGEGRTSCEFLPMGWSSALVVSSGSMDSNHVMLTAQTGDYNSSVLEVLGRIISAKYLLPELRDRRGAYGAGFFISDGEMTFSCAGAVKPDEVIGVYKNTGEWLRKLTLTERELNGYRLGALKEFDDRAGWSRGDAAMLAMTGTTQADFTSKRSAIMNVTLEDLRACAELLDTLAAQNHVFAQVNDTADIDFPFSVHVNSATGGETVCLRDIAQVSDDNSTLTRGEMAVMLYERLICPGEPEHPETKRFADVPPENALADSVTLLYDLGILKGYSDGTLKPENPISRAEFCVISARLCERNGGESPTEFSDVPQTHWAYEQISNMAANGILFGDGKGSFHPDDAVTRHEAELILQRIAQIS